MKRFLFILLCLFCAVHLSAQKIYVVSIGVADYADPEVRDLRFTENDALSFNKILKTHTDEIYTLLGSRATHANVCGLIDHVFAKATDRDVVMLFFSGHGFPGGFCCHDMTDSGGGLTYTELASSFRKCRAGRKMVFADACFSGGLRKEDKRRNSSNQIRQSDIMFFLSSRTNETSQEMIGGPNGQFTRFLVRGLGGGADANRDRIVTARELFKFVHDGVAVATAKKQHPVMWGRFSHDMHVINWNRR